MKYARFYPEASAVPGDHPKFILDAVLLAELRNRAAIPSAEWLNLRAYCDSFATGVVYWPDDDPYAGASPPNVINAYQGTGFVKPLLSHCLAYQIVKAGPAYDATRAANYLAKALEITRKYSTDAHLYNQAHTYRSWATDYCYALRNWQWLAVAYDWLYDDLTTDDKNAIIWTLNNFLDSYYNIGFAGPSNAVMTAMDNYCTAYFSALPLTARLTAPENTRTTEFYNFWHDVLYAGTWKGIPQVKTLFNTRLKGGSGWPEGWNYGPQSILNMAWGHLAEKYAGTLDLHLDGHTWTVENGTHLLYEVWPWFKTPSDICYIPSLNSWSEKTITPTDGIVLYNFILKLYNDPNATLTQSYVTALISAMGISLFNPWILMAFYNPSAPSEPYSNLPLARVATGTGYAFSRSDWTTDAVWVQFMAGRQPNPGAGHQYGDDGSICIVKGDRPLLPNPTGWFSQPSPTTFAFYVAIDESSYMDRYHNFYYPYNVSHTYRGQSRYDYSETRPVMSRFETTEDYVNARGDYLGDHYYDGTTNTLTNKVCADWNRTVLHLRPNIVVVYDRTTRTAIATNERIQWHLERATQIPGQPTGNTRWDAQTLGLDQIPVFMGALQTIFPASATVTRTNLFEELRIGGTDLQSDGDGKIKPVSRRFMNTLVGKTLTITSAGTGLALGEYTVTAVSSDNYYLTVTPSPGLSKTGGSFTSDWFPNTTNDEGVSFPLTINSDAFYGGRLYIRDHINRVLRWPYPDYTINIWEAGTGFTLGDSTITAVDANGWATINPTRGISKTGGTWKCQNGRDGYRIGISPTDGALSHTWLNVFEVAANTGAVHTATGFSGSTYEGVVIDDWAVCFPKAGAGFGVAPPSYTVPVGSLRHLITDLVANEDYLIDCKTAGGDLVQTRIERASAYGTVDFTAGATEVNFTVYIPFSNLSFEDKTSSTNLFALYDAWHTAVLALGRDWWPAAVSGGDFAGTGKTDLVFSCHGSGCARVFSNTGLTGGYPQFADNTAANTLSGDFNNIGADGSTVTLDINNDGYPDILGLTDEGTPSVAINDGTGKFDVSSRTFDTSQVHLSDTTGSGYIDIVGLLSVNKTPITNYVNNGDGTYTTTYNATYGEFISLSPEMILPAMSGLKYPINRRVTLGGPHYSEIILSSWGESAYSVRYAKTFAIALDGGTWKDITAEIGLPVVPIDGSNNGNVAAVYDFNGDGLQDVLIIGGPAPGIYLNNGNGQFVRQLDDISDYYVGSSETVMCSVVDVIADFNEDGRPEILITTGRYGTSTKLFQNVGGYYVQALNLSPCFQCVVADFNGDGRLDILGLSTATPKLWINTTPALGNWINIRLTGPATNKVAVDAIIDVYEAGWLDNPAYKLATVKNNTYGSPPKISITGIGHSYGGNLPIHVGLGIASSVDIRVTYPGGSTVTALGQSTNTTISM